MTSIHLHQLMENHHAIRKKSECITITNLSGGCKKGLANFSSRIFRSPDGLTPQYIHDLLSGTSDDKLLNAVTELVNLLLAGSFNKEINEMIYGGLLITLAKKDGKNWAN